VSIGAVRYLSPPVLDYPIAARRAREEGRVHVRVLVDAEGRPAQTQVVRSSGFQRLDASALATVAATRFRPYTENGVALPFWVVMPLVFELEN
jgi:protein TonB